VSSKLALGPVPGQALAARAATTADDGATILGGHTGQETKLAHATLLGGL
jgi:hypothetical protein